MIEAMTHYIGGSEYQVHVEANGTWGVTGSGDGQPPAKQHVFIYAQVHWSKSPTLNLGPFHCSGPITSCVSKLDVRITGCR